MIKSVDHFSFTVGSIETALNFFRDQLGLRATPVMEVENENVQKIVGFPDALLRISIVQIPGGSNLELIEYVRPEGALVDSKSCNPGAAHIAFEVGDIQSLYQNLSAKGIQFIHAPVWAPGNDGKGTWGVCYLKGPDGITVELVEKKS
jgi:catechol 2,3-dioxygenase-like lactoylglutathione lyase family enzyme